MRWVAALLLACAALAICAEPVYELTADIAPPRLTHHVNPQYPENLHGLRIRGTVAIGVVVTSKGMPDNPQVVKSLDKEVDSCAVEAVRQWRFAPAQKQGKPVAVHITVEIEFHSM